MTSFRIHLLDMSMTAKSVLRGRERDGVQDRIDHRSLHSLDTETATGCDLARLATVKYILSSIRPSNRNGSISVISAEW